MTVKFKNPPVAERILGVQFEELNFFTDPHAGWFWKNWLDEEYDAVSIAPPIKSTFERFDDDPVAVQPPGLEFVTAPNNRTQLRRSSDMNLIQLQNTRFHLNCTNRDAEYEEYSDLFARFDDSLSKFRDFVATASEEVVNINQWEITYTNQVEAGDLWNSVDDWAGVIKNLHLPHTSGTALDGMAANWSWVLENQTGRMHAALQQRLSRSSGQVLLYLEYTCRGPISEDVDYKAGLQIGHDAIIEAFCEMTTESAQKEWGRLDG